MGGPKTNYMTLGPKLYLFSVFSPRICFCFVKQYCIAGIAAFFEILIFRPRSTFSWTFAPGGRLSYEAYNVFTFLIYIYITFTLHLHFITFLIYIYITFTFTFHWLFKFTLHYIHTHLTPPLGTPPPGVRNLTRIHLKTAPS